MKTLKENNGTTLGVYDEFSTFLDNLDKGTTGSSEKGRYLSLFSAVDWSKKTKSSGSLNIKDPRFNLMSFTQPFYVLNFVKNSQLDGFCQRFLISMPQEKLVYIDEKLNFVKEKNQGTLDFSQILQLIYTVCQTATVLTLDESAFNEYKIIHDEIVKFRGEDLFEEDLLSIKSKSLGHITRVSGVISLLRNAESIYQGKNQEFNHIICKDDFLMAKYIVSHSNDISFALMDKKHANHSSSHILKPGIPDPENMTIDFLVPHQKFVKRLLRESEVPLSIISRDNLYPVINKEKGALVANRFVRGLCTVGLGKIDEKTKRFKRFLVSDDDCPDKENLESKWRKLNIDT